MAAADERESFALYFHSLGKVLYGGGGDYLKANARKPPPRPPFQPSLRR